MLASQDAAVSVAELVVEDLLEVGHVVEEVDQA